MIYSKLCERYEGLTPNMIAEMTPHQQLAMYAPNDASDTLYFANEEEYSRWRMRRG